MLRRGSKRFGAWGMPGMLIFRRYVSFEGGWPSWHTTWTTLPETNIAREKLPSQEETHLPNHQFSGAMLNFGGVCIQHALLSTHRAPPRNHLFWCSGSRPKISAPQLGCRLNREDPIDGYHHDFNSHHKPDGPLACPKKVEAQISTLHLLEWTGTVRGTGGSGRYVFYFWNAILRGHCGEKLLYD